MTQAKLISQSDPNHHLMVSSSILKGQVVGTLWSYHLYFLACNALDPKAVARINQIKGRPKDQVLVSPGSEEEAEEFADLKSCPTLLFSSKKMNMTPKQYLKFLFKKFPLGIELFASNKAPHQVTFETDNGKTIWLAAHNSDKNYLKLLRAIRQLRKGGQKIIIAGTSLNLAGTNTLTALQIDKVKEDFGNKIDLISVHPKADRLKRVKYSTSCSVISFIHPKPRLLRVGSTPAKTLLKYIPDLEIPQNPIKARKKP